MWYICVYSELIWGFLVIQAEIQGMIMAEGEGGGHHIT